MRRGHINASHFAHYPEAREARLRDHRAQCSGESVAHKAAKQVILDHYGNPGLAPDVTLVMKCQGVAFSPTAQARCEDNVTIPFTLPEYDTVALELAS